MARPESLRERLALMKAALDREPVGIALLTYPELRYTYANAAMRRVLGTDPLGKLQDETCSDYPWPPRTQMRSVAEKGTRLTSIDSRWVMPRLPGAEPEELFFTFEVSRVMVGDTVFLLATAMETTDEVEARRRGDAVVERMQEVLDSVHESIVSLDEHWRITFANKQAAARFGRAGEPLLHRSFLDLFGEYDARRLEQHLLPAMCDRQDVEFEATLSADQTRYRVRAFPGSAGISVYLAPLAGAETSGPGEVVQALLGLVGVPVTIFDRSGRIVAVDRAAADLFGLESGALLGKTLEESMGPDAPEWVADISECLGEHRSFRVIARGRSGDLVEHRGAPVEAGAVMVSREISTP